MHELHFHFSQITETIHLCDAYFYSRCNSYAVQFYISVSVRGNGFTILLLAFSI